LLLSNGHCSINVTLRDTHISGDAGVSKFYGKLIPFISNDVVVLKLNFFLTYVVLEDLFLSLHSKVHPGLLSKWQRDRLSGCVDDFIPKLVEVFHRVLLL